MGESRDLHEYGAELYGIRRTGVWEEMCEGRGMISVEAGWPSALNKCLVTVLNGGKGSMFVEINGCIGELRDQNIQCFLQTWSKMRRICEMEIKDLGPIKTNPRHLAVCCPRRGIANVCHLVFCPRGISFQVTKFQLGIWDQRCTGGAHLWGWVPDTTLV